MLYCHTDCVQSLIDAFPQAAVVHAPSGEIVAANKSASAVLGVHLEALLGRESFDPRWRAVRIDGSEFPGESHPAMRTLATREPVVGEIMGIEVPDQGLRWISVTTRPIDIMDPNGRIGVLAIFNWTGIRQYEGARLHKGFDFVDTPLYNLTSHYFDRLKSSLYTINEAIKANDRQELEIANVIASESSTKLEKWLGIYHLFSQRIDRIQENQSKWAQIRERQSKNGLYAIKTELISDEGLNIVSNGIYNLLELFECIAGPSSAIAIDSQSIGLTTIITIVTSYTMGMLRFLDPRDINSLMRGKFLNNEEQAAFSEILNILECTMQSELQFCWDGDTLSIIILHTKDV